MNKIILVLFFMCSSANCKYDILNYWDIEGAVQSRLPQFTEGYLNLLLERVKSYLPAKQTFDDDADLTSEMIIKAMDNFRDALPKKIPLIPYVMVEPMSNNNLMYFGMYNSDVVNLTQFDANASVTNTTGSTSINISLVIDSSLLEGHYELDLSGAGMHIYGDGNYRITSKKTELDISIIVQILEDGSFLMTDFLVDMYVNSTKIELDNLLGGDRTVDPFVDFMGQLVPTEVAAISSLLQDTVNTTIVNFTNSDFTKIMSWRDVVFIIKLAAGYYT